MSEKLKAIFFDFDGTLADDGEAIQTALAAACQVVCCRWAELDASELATTYRQISDAAWGDYDQRLRHLISPEAMLAAVWRETFAHWGLQDIRIEQSAAETYWQQRLQHCQVYPDVFPLLHTLRERFHLSILTNGAPAMQRAKVAAAGLSPLFHQVFVGGDFARGKPDQAIFHAALAAASCRPDQAIHVGDSLVHDIAGACSVGMRSVWLNRKGAPSVESPHTPDFHISSLENLLECLERSSNE